MWWSRNNFWFRLTGCFSLKQHVIPSWYATSGLRQHFGHYIAWSGYTDPEAYAMVISRRGFKIWCAIIDGVFCWYSFHRHSQNNCFSGNNQAYNQFEISDDLFTIQLRQRQHDCRYLCLHFYNEVVIFIFNIEAAFCFCSRDEALPCACN